MKKNAFTLLLCALVTNTYAQEYFDSLLNISATKYPQEKIYLHYDKTYYNPGETIWFKAYITEKSNPSAISKSMYAELLDGNGAVLQRKTMPIFQSGAASFFELDTVYRPKMYIKAYTSWMLNFDSTLLYLKPITLINPKQTAQKKQAASVTVTLFAEGGDAIENINTRMAFKATDTDGMPVNISGTVTDSKNKTIATAVSTHNGMGLFTYTPLYDETYTFTWKAADGKYQKTVLPTAKQDGVALRVQQTNGAISYTLNRNETASDLYKEFTVLAQINQQTVYGAKIRLQERTQVTAPIVADSLPDGVMTLTIFNANNIPVAERLVFVNNNSYYFLTDLHATKKDLTPHGKNVFQIDVGASLRSNLSVAITDAGLEAETKNKENIFSNLLLTSDLKGYVYNPAYYFSSDADSVKQQLDLVMMTNGWRRYNWQDMMNGKWPNVTYKPDNYITIQGNIYGLSKTQMKGKTLTAIVRTGKGAGDFLSIALNDDGTFSVPNSYFFDTAKLYYQINGDKDKKLTSSASFKFSNGFEKPQSAAYKSLEQQFFNSSPDVSVLQKSAAQYKLFASAIALEKTKTLQAVIVQGKQKSAAEKLDEKYASGLFSGGFSKTFAIEDDPLAQASMSILDYLRSRVAGLQITTGVGTGSATRRGSDVAFFMNEMQTDVDLVQNTPMADVAMIKVFDPPFMGASGGGPGGAVAVYTRKGAANTANVKGLNEVSLAGYSAYKEFYMPNYDNTNATGGDYRSTLYWNPYILMDIKTRRVTLPVFNNSNGKKIRVVIEGINEIGQLTREEKVFE
jgi:hypothetical protein